MRIFNKSLAVAACVAAVTFGAVAPPAQALILWEHENYKGYLGTYSGETWYVGDKANDKASSLTKGKNELGSMYYEDYGYLGRRFFASSDLNCLRCISDGLHWGETWEDRISSIKNY